MCTRWPVTLLHLQMKEMLADPEKFAAAAAAAAPAAAAATEEKKEEKKVCIGCLILPNITLLIE